MKTDIDPHPLAAAPEKAPMGETESADLDSSIVLRLAESDDEVIAAQRLRYNVFYEEFGAKPSAEVLAQKRDFDDYDQYADHLIVFDTSRSAELGQIVGTYRLFRAERMPADLPFYTTHEFDISPLLSCGGKLLELGRSCVLPEYRTKYVMQRLWQGIAGYLSTHEIDLMFGCASFQGTDPKAIEDQLAYLHYYHQPPENLYPKASPDCTVGLNFKPKEELDVKRVFSDLPPLVKGYLRLGAYIGQGAYLDTDFNSIDVCIVLPTHKVTSKYMRHYERKLQKDVVRDSDFSKNFKSSD
ncbi:MAG: GNAT family N-acyltransferase [Pseudobdellovibrionaceae bacterium]